MIHLRKINAKNVWETAELKAAKEQEDFVASNSECVIEAYVSQRGMCRRC